MARFQLASLGVGVCLDDEGRTLAGQSFAISGGPLYAASSGTATLSGAQLVTGSHGVAPGWLDPVTDAGTYTISYGSGDPVTFAVGDPEADLPFVSLLAYAGTFDEMFAAAHAALGSGEGTIAIPAGNYTATSPLVCTGTGGLIIQGAGGLNAGGLPGTRITYTGSGARFIDARSSVGFQLRDVQILYSNAAFTGKLVDFTAVTTDTTSSRIDSCYLGGSGVATAGCLVSYNKAICCEIANCKLDRAVVGIIGRDTAGDYSNEITIHNVIFTTMTTANIQAAGQGWTISSPTMQQLASGAAGGYYHNNIGGAGVTFLGGWWGDGNGTGTLIDWKGSGLTVKGNYLASAATAIALGASSFGADISGNLFTACTTAVTIAVSCKEVVYHANDYQTVTNRYTLAGARPVASTLPGPTSDVVATDAPASRVTHNANQAVANVTNVVLAFNTERFDNDTMHDNATNNSRLTCRTPGKYLIGFQGRWAAGAGTFRYVQIRLNAGTTMGEQALAANAGFGPTHNMSIPYDMTVGDYVEVIAHQNSGGPLDMLTSTNLGPDFWMVQVA